MCVEMRRLCEHGMVEHKAMATWSRVCVVRLRLRGRGYCCRAGAMARLHDSAPRLSVMLPAVAVEHRRWFAGGPSQVPKGQAPGAHLPIPSAARNYYIPWTSSSDARACVCSTTTLHPPYHTTPHHAMLYVCHGRRRDCGRASSFLLPPISRQHPPRSARPVFHGRFHDTRRHRATLAVFQSSIWAD